MIYNMNDPPITIFNAIEDSLQLATAANSKKSQQQIINYGIELLKSNGEFDTRLTTWFNRPPTDMTWAIFKKHFSDAYKTLLKIRGNTMQNTPYHQVNQAIQK